MRIAFNTIPIRPGGGLTVTLGLLQSLRQWRPEVELVVFCSATDTAAAISASRNASEMVMAVPDATNGRCFLWQNLHLGRQLTARRVDVLVTFNHYLRNIPCKQVVYHVNVRRFSPEHREDRLVSRLRESMRDRAARAALARADANVFESQFLRGVAEATTRIPARAGEVIYIGLPNQLVRTAAAAPLQNMSSSRLIAITSPHPHKDNVTLIETLAELVRRKPNVPWHLDVAGGRNLEAWQPFQRLAEQLSVADRISWHGFCEQEKLDMLLRRALCLVSTSVMESFAMVPLESMARGCPPIVANTSSMPESVGPAGILVPPHDARGFAAAILQLYENPARRQEYAERGRQHIQDFQWSRCGAQFGQLFERLCA